MEHEVRRLTLPPVKPGEYMFSVIGLEHGHIYGMASGLIEAGAQLKWVWDSEPEKAKAFTRRYPQARIARSRDEVLLDPQVSMVAGAAVTGERCALGISVMEAGKDYFTDKGPLTTLSQLDAAKAACARTGRRYFCYYSERLHSECSEYAGELIKDGAIGQVVQVLGLGPHRLSPEGRPEWFFDKKRYGGIIIDIGSHQIEQFLYYTGAKDAKVTASRTANYSHPEYPGLEDFGDASLLAVNGASGYFRVDWLSPGGLSTWGDARTILLGTEGYIELRKNVNVAADKGGDHVFLADGDGEHYINVRGKVGCPFFGQMIRDSLDGTQKAMTQEHIFRAAELSVRAQIQADMARYSTEEL